jgi:hypothetical protein
LNTGTAAGFVSEKRYLTYTHTVDLSSSSGDNDTIGVVIAFVTEGTFGQAGYREHTLSVIRSGGGVGEAVGTWSLVYNYLQSDQVVISNGSSSVPATGGWAALGSTRVEIVRSGNSITARTSAFGSTTLLSGSALTVNLTSAAYLAKFQGSKQYGYLVYSQSSSFFTNATFSGVSDDDGLVYDVVTGNVYGASSESPYYQDVTDVVSPFSEISELGRFYHNPDSGTTVWRSSFDEQTYIITNTNYALPLTGGTMTGDIVFSDNQEGIVWSRNTDGASIKFYNTGDGDTNSRLEFQTLDNGNEYFRWTHIAGATTYNLMTLVQSGGVGNLNVTGSLTASSKSFLINHPTKEKMKLQYSSLEGPEAGVYVRGRLKNDNIIELPDYWTGLVDEETITVNLTPISKHQNIFVERVIDNKVILKDDTLNNNEIDCFYIAFAERKDIPKLIVEQNEEGV